MLDGAKTGLAAAGIQAEVPDPVTRRREAVNPADRRHQRRGRRDVDAGDRHQPADLRVADGVTGDLAFDLGELAGEKVGLADAAGDRRVLIVGKLEALQPVTALAGEDVAGRAATAEVANQRRVNLIARPRAATHELRAPGDPATQHRVASSQIQTPGSIPAASSLAIMRASTRS